MATWVVGDVHGCLEQVQAVLQRASLIDADRRWSGATDHLWFLGDYTDRGPNGVGVIELIMRLQDEANDAGGFVGALLGNHDLILLNAQRYGSLGVPGFLHNDRKFSFRDLWLHNAGGQLADEARLEPRHLAWLAARPALALVGDTLLMHADSTFYLEYGDNVDEVNAGIRAVIQRHDPDAADQLEERFARRRAFLPQWSGEDAASENLNAVLQTFRAAQLVHGHTPIFNVLDRPADQITGAWSYQAGRCVNVDAGLYAGGPGFACWLESHPPLM